jgi:hypothetical protein
MTLTYTRRQRRLEEEKTEHTVVPYKDWAMFSAAGNRRLRNYAAAAIKKAEKAIAEGKKSRFEIAQNVCVELLCKWERLCDSKNHGEAGDTAVREVVGAFHDELYLAIAGDHYGISDVWDKHRDMAYFRVQKERDKKKGK